MEEKHDRKESEVAGKGAGIDHSIQCHECFAYGGLHSPFCSQQTPEQVKERLKQYYDRWLSISNNQNEKHKIWNGEIARWQGKCRILKHENNQLRNKLRKAGIIK